MGEWKIALIAAGAAILGSLVTGFFAWLAGHRQAAGAEAAGTAQANALIATVQATLQEQRRSRLLEQRRQAYVQFLTGADEGNQAAGRPFVSRRELTPRMAEGLAALQLEGPQAVADAGDTYVRTILDAASNGRSPNENAVRVARHEFLCAARDALNIVDADEAS
ncbi:hypothetical protein [Streptomyces sp. NPDC046371]|uniref:hypothetical protein n=1 Tax=Streptomyces sp. NPDC046371 TaxID=3154916 RepID=UPI0033CF41DC